MAEAIRRGTPQRHPYEGTSREVDKPVPGHYAARLVSGGPVVPVLMFRPCPMDPWFGFAIERPRPLFALVLGRWYDPRKIWTRCHPCSRQEFEVLERRARDLGIEGRRARQPVDLAKERSLF